MTSLKRFMLASDVKCNDGSTAGFYHRLAPNSRRWIVFLEGGWYCFNGRSCRSRWKTSGHLMSSLAWAEHRNVGGVLSSDPAENPHWWRSNHVFIPYCSSDCWSGTRRGNSNLTFNQVYSMFNDMYWYSRGNDSRGDDSDVSPFQVTNLPFMGALILEEVMKKLVTLGLADGHSVLLAGSSAGGIGVLLNLDNVQALLLRLGVRVDVRGVADSAWFLDNKPFAPMVCHDAHTCPPTQALKLGHGLWKSRLPNMCGIRAKERPWECFLGYKVLPTIQGSLFIFQWIFDEAQMLLDNVGKPVSKQQWNYIHSIGERIKQSLNNISAVFAPSCIAHTALTTRRWNLIKIGDISLSDSLHCWAKLSSKTPISKGYETQLGSKESSIAGIHEAKIDSEPLPKFSSQQVNSDSGVSTNIKRIRHVKKKRKRKCRKCRQRKKKRRKSQKVTDEGGLRTRRRNRFSERRSNELSLHLRPLVDTMVVSAEGMVADSPNLTSKEGFESLYERGSSTVTTKSHGEKPRRRNKQKRERKRKRRKKKKHRKNRRKEKREEKRKKKKKRKNRTGPQRGTSTQTEESLRPPQQEDHGTEHKTTVCPLHLVDTCSWPHCNPTCPPLINPYTGEEMTRVQLLRSFGLSMLDLANALGIDLATLQAMDNKDIFLILSP